MDMQAFIRSSIAALVLVTGCRTTGGKVFGTVTLASAVGSVYLLNSSSTTLDNGRAVLKDDHMDAGAALMFAAVAAAGGWFLSEYVSAVPGAL